MRPQARLGSTSGTPTAVTCCSTSGNSVPARRRANAPGSCASPRSAWPKPEGGSDAALTADRIRRRSESDVHFWYLRRHFLDAVDALGVRQRVRTVWRQVEGTTSAAVTGT